MISKGIFSMFPTRQFSKLAGNSRLFSKVFVNHRQTPDNTDSTPFEFTDENYEEIEKLLQKYPSNYKKSATIPMLFIAQKQNNNFLSLNGMRKVASILEIPEVEVFEVASFYTMFNREKVGKYHIQFCGTTPCMLCGIRDVIAASEKHLDTKLGHTSKDGLFTLVEVECLGACANAPMLQINGEWVYEDLDSENVIELLDTLKRGEKPKVGPQNNRKNSEGKEGRSTLKDFKPELTSRDFSAVKAEWEKAQEQ